MSRVSRRSFLRTSAGAGLTATASPLLARYAGATEEIRIGAVCELSGPASTIGAPQAQGIQMAVDDINKTGGIVGKGPGVLGRPLKVLIEDSESKVATGLAKAKKLVERDRVHGLTGVIFSSISLAIQEYVNKEARIPFINAGSGNPAVSEPPACGKYTFQGLANSRALALASTYAAKKYGPRWFFIADDYGWGRHTVQLTKDAIKLEGPLEVAGEEYPAFGTTNYAPYITKAMTARPDVIGLVVFGAGYARLLKQLGQMGVKSHIYHNFWSQVDANAAGDVVVGMTSAHQYMFENPKVPRANQFAEAFRARFGSWPDPAAAGGYHVVEILALAIAQAGGTQPAALVNAIEGLRFDSLMGPYRFRDWDHAAVSPVYVLEGKRNEKYGYYAAFIDQITDTERLMLPRGKTGCEPAMKQT